MRFCWRRGREVVRFLLAGGFKDGLKVSNRYCCLRMDLIYSDGQAKPTVESRVCMYSVVASVLNDLKPRSPSIREIATCTWPKPHSS